MTPAFQIYDYTFELGFYAALVRCDCVEATRETILRYTEVNKWITAMPEAQTVSGNCFICVDLFMVNNKNELWKMSILKHYETFNSARADSIKLKNILNK